MYIMCISTIPLLNFFFNQNIDETGKRFNWSELSRFNTFKILFSVPAATPPPPQKNNDIILFDVMYIERVF